MLFKKAKIIKINNKKDLEKYTLNYSQSIKVPSEVISGRFLIFIRMSYKEYDNEKLLHAMISDNYKIYITRAIRLVFNDPVFLTYRSTFIYVSKPYVV